MIDQYLLLSKHFEQDKEYETSIDELAQALTCSTRYAKTVMKKLSEENWLKWETFQGRGKKPRITLLLGRIDATLMVLTELWEKGQYQRAFQLLQDEQLVHVPEINDWINQQYGIETSSNMDRFRYHSGNVELNFDPLLFISRHDLNIAEQIYDTLFIFCPETGKAKPHLVFGFHTTDHQTWIFTLHKGIRFHNGKNLTSHDVIASLERANVSSGKHWQFHSLEALDNYRFTVELSKPNTLLPRYLSNMKMAILSKDWIGQGATGAPIGSGPFKLIEHNQDITSLKAHTDYFSTRPWIDKVEIIHTPFQIDFGVSTRPFPDDVPVIKKVFKEKGADFILLNASSRSVLQQDKLRSALYSMINPIDYCLTEYGEFVAQGIRHAFKQQSNQAITITPDASWFPPLKIGVQQIREGVNHLREADILSKQLHQYGIQHKVELCPYRLKPEKIAERYDIFVGGIALSTDEIFSMLTVFDPARFPPTAFAGEQVRADIYALTEQITRSEDDLLIRELIDQMETLLQQSMILKPLAHRVHNLYIRHDSPFAGIEMDQSGKVDFRRVFRR